MKTRHCVVQVAKTTPIVKKAWTTSGQSLKSFDKINYYFKINHLFSFWTKCAYLHESHWSQTTHDYGISTKQQVFWVVHGWNINVSYYPCQINSVHEQNYFIHCQYGYPHFVVIRVALKHHFELAYVWRIVNDWRIGIGIRRFNWFIWWLSVWNKGELVWVRSRQDYLSWLR